MVNRYRAASIIFAVVAGAALSGTAQRQMRERQIVVSVVDKANQPIADLGPADFVVREDDVAREVLRVEQASAPMQVALLADTSDGTQLMIQDIRKGLQGFAKVVLAANPESQISLWEFGDRPTRVADFTSTASVLDRGINRLFEHTNGGAYMLEAIMEAAQALKKKEAKRPVIVAFASEGSPEFSPQTYQEVEDALRRIGAALWVLDLTAPGGPRRSDENRNRGIVAGDVTARSGGDRDILLDRMIIERRFQDVAARLTKQYTVTYSRPDSLIPPTKLEVTTKRADARVIASRWAGQ